MREVVEGNVVFLALNGELVGWYWGGGWRCGGVRRRGYGFLWRGRIVDERLTLRSSRL